MAKTNPFLLFTAPFNTAVEASQHTPGERPLCQEKLINNVLVSDILALGIEDQTKPKKKQKII